MPQGTCDAPDCNNNRAKTGKYCHKHAWRLRVHGSFDLPSKPSLAERFWAKVDKNGPLPSERPELGPCWIWTAAKLDTGYGFIGHERKTSLAHRVGYELMVGPIPKGLVIDHLCRRTSCVRHTHLEAVPQAVNTQRGRWPEVIQAYYERLRTKSHCKNGHEYTEENTRRGRDGGRSCIACSKSHSAKSYKRRLAARAAA